MAFSFSSIKKPIVYGVFTAAFGTVALTIPASAVSPGKLSPANTGAYSGSVSGSYVLGAANLASGNPFNDYGIEGEVVNDVGGVAMLGYGLPAKSYGVYGVSFGTNGIGVYGSGDGPTPAPSATPSLALESTGVVGNSASGEGVFGSTEFPNFNADSLTNPAAGVIGEDNYTSAYTDNMGIAGETTDGDFGVAGLSGTGAIGGVVGTGYGGVFGISFDDGSDFPNAAGGWFSGTYAIYGQSATASGSSNLSYPLYLEDSANAPLFYVDNSGNVSYSGTLTALARTRSAAVKARTYTPSSTHPTTEDFGEAQLVNGASYVRLDPTFAQSIDDRTAYMVFVTPEGDTNGVYVSGKSMSGFTVRENKGGRSNVAFSYRIVAAQYGTTGQRSELVATTSIGRAAAAGHSASVPGQARTARFARLMQRIRTRHALQTFRPTPNLAVESRFSVK
jgi:hypothetical protein